jgi:hypothetical protein
MNRYERRAARSRKVKVGDIILEIRRGRCLMTQGNDAVLQCFVCHGPATTWPDNDGTLRWGCISVNGDDIRPLCEACFNDENGIARKLLGAPDMVITDGGVASPEEVREIADAMRERDDSSVH